MHPNNIENKEEDFSEIFARKQKKLKDKLAGMIPEFSDNIQEEHSAPKLKINDSSIQFEYDTEGKYNAITFLETNLEDSIQDITLLNLNDKVTLNSKYWNIDLWNQQIIRWRRISNESTDSC